MLHSCFSTLKSALKLNRSNYLFLLLIFAGLMILFLAIFVRFLSFFISVSSYQEGHCTILSKQLIIVQSDYTTTYQPYFTYAVFTKNGKIYRASGYDGMSTSTIDYTQERAIVDSYRIGATYACWYNSGNARMAILIQPISAWTLFFPGLGFFVGLFLFLITYRGYHQRILQISA